MIKAVKLFIKENTIIDVLFNNRKVIRYDTLSLANKYPILLELKNRELFLKGHLFGYSAIVWNDDIDIDVETIFEDGIDVSNEYHNIENYIIGFNIKEKRLQMELTQIEFSKMIGMDQADLSKLEKGLLNPTVKILERIAERLNLKVTIDIK